MQSFIDDSRLDPCFFFVAGRSLAAASGIASDSFIHFLSFHFFLLGAASLRLPASLQIKVAVEKFRPTLDKCCKKGQGKERGPFYGCNAQFISSLVTKLKSTFLMPVQQKSHKPATTTPERAVFTRFRRPS